MIPREILLTVRRLASRSNPRIKDWACLGDKGERDRLGLTLAEGAKLAEEALSASPDAAFRPRTLLVSDSGADRPEAGALFARAGELGVERFSLTDDCYAKVAAMKNSDGLAVVMEFSRETPDLPALMGGNARWLVAAGVQDPGNAGALARTALAAGATGCLFLDGADPASPKFLRGSMGAAFRLPCLSMPADVFAAAWPGCGGKLLIAASAGEGGDFRTADYAPPLALLVGGERGIPPALLDLGGATIHIALQNNVESLNLAVAAGIILFEAEKRWRDMGL